MMSQHTRWTSKTTPHGSKWYGIECETLKDPPRLKNPKDWFDFKEALYAQALNKHSHSLVSHWCIFYAIM